MFWFSVLLLRAFVSRLVIVAKELIVVRRCSTLDVATSNGLGVVVLINEGAGVKTDSTLLYRVSVDPDKDLSADIAPTLSNPFHAEVLAIAIDTVTADVMPEFSSTLAVKLLFSAALLFRRFVFMSLLADKLGAAWVPTYDDIGGEFVTLSDAHCELFLIARSTEGTMVVPRVTSIDVDPLFSLGAVSDTISDLLIAVVFVMLRGNKGILGVITIVLFPSELELDA
jgi:hypothetical protein